MAQQQNSFFTPVTPPAILPPPAASEVENRADATRQPLSEVVRTSTCPACGHHVAVAFYDAGQLPLTTLAWPASRAQAESMQRLPHDFVRCVDCGHVYNAQFDYAHVPYSDKPNLMFNRGATWTEHLKMVRNLIAERLPAHPTVVEIGCGDGHLLRGLAEQVGSGRFVGFDPNAQIEAGDGLIEAQTRLFDPAVHLAEYRPDLIISRHVLEHLLNPLGFVQALAFAASWHNTPTRLFIEVPCIDRVFAMGRTVDFFYEHNSHFTTRSLRKMLSRCASDVRLVKTSYNAEVVFALAEFARREEHVGHAAEALQFRADTARYATALAEQFDQLAASPESVAIWGGTGKAAAFINQHGLDAERFPLVVDSDAQKVGTYVPGAGQRIRAREELREQPAGIILIATQWRASDIYLEIQKHGIPYRQILVEHQGRLLDFLRDPHPYGVQAVARQGGAHKNAVPPPQGLMLVPSSSKPTR